MSDNYLIHFGTKNSGRYPRGSGERPHQHDGLRIGVKRYVKKAEKIRNSKNKASSALEKQVDKYSDFDDIDYFKSLSKSNQKKEIERGKKVLQEYKNEAKIWNEAVEDISNSKNWKEAKRLFNQTNNFKSEKQRYINKAIGEQKRAEKVYYNNKSGLNKEKKSGTYKQAQIAEKMLKSAKTPRELEQVRKKYGKKLTSYTGEPVVKGWLN